MDVGDIRINVWEREGVRMVDSKLSSNFARVRLFQYMYTEQKMNKNQVEFLFRYDSNFKKIFSFAIHHT